MTWKDRGFAKAVANAKRLGGTFGGGTWTIPDDNPVFRVERTHDANFDAVAYLAGCGLTVVRNNGTAWGDDPQDNASYWMSRSGQ